MTSRGSDPQVAALSRIDLYVGRYYYRMMAYNIGGNNYLKLRDIASLLNFSVEWDGANNTIIIDTSSDYVPE